MSFEGQMELITGTPCSGLPVMCSNSDNKVQFNKRLLTCRNSLDQSSRIYVFSNRYSARKNQVQNEQKRRLNFGRNYRIYFTIPVNILDSVRMLFSVNIISIRKISNLLIIFQWNLRYLYICFKNNFSRSPSSQISILLNNNDDANFLFYGSEIVFTVFYILSIFFHPPPN